jgi:hypothetical protein
MQRAHDKNDQTATKCIVKLDVSVVFIKPKGSIMASDYPIAKLLGVPGVAAVEAGYADVECYGQLHKYNV